jgi:hypothetical protein
MGQDVFIWPIDKGRTLSRRMIEDILDRDALEPCRLNVALYPDGQGEIFCGEDDETEVESLMISHFGGPTIIERMFEIADRTESLICWSDSPDGPPIAITKEALFTRLHPDLQKDDPPVAIAKDARHLAALMGRDYDTDRIRIIYCSWKPTPPPV